MNPYEPHAIERKWQEVWEAQRAFEVPNPAPGAPHNPRKRYVLEMLPYPSGSLHMGHMLVYTIGDVRAHFYRRNGFEVLRPMGFDSFGLPAENAAIKDGGHPREIVERNIATITRTMKTIGWAIDWSREVSTHEPTYYRWTQWLFLQLFAAGLADRRAAPVKWCPNDQTVLANEQVKDGHCERCGALVESRNIEQWFFKTTDYADQLLDFSALDWPERVIAAQRHWIGRSEGAEVTFGIDGFDESIAVFTTRPDTLFGATFFALAPEHPLVTDLAERAENGAEILEYVRHAGAKRAEERAAAVEKTGVFTGAYAINPVNGERLPIWVADYVLMDYGTGAIMAVPAHDERDREFAEKFSLPIVTVISEDDRLVDSESFSGLSSAEGKAAITAWLAEQGKGEPAVNYRLRDWGFSRQRYWGCPIPIIHCPGCGSVPVPDEDLPVLLPEIDDYRPKGEAPLASNEEWMRAACPNCGGEGRREAETMDTFVDSSWYFLRYCDPHNSETAFDRGIVDYWGPVDFYQGGVDHATMHMIYARFFQKALADIGLVGFREPFARFHGNGWVQLGGTKMSKSKGNVVGPDEFVAEYGADPVRLYILFIGPAEQDMEFTDSGLEGMLRFVRRLWRIVNEVAETEPREGEPGALARKAHETIARVTDDLGRRESFNTAISAVMELVNELSRDVAAPDARFAAEAAVSLIQPYAPHVTEELWTLLGHSELWKEPWPVADESMLQRETVQIVLQVNGKVRDRIEAPAGLSEEALIALALGSEKVQGFLDGQEPRAFVVPDKLVNLVI
ncbi:MAG TPA: leucine--tRNA ligase [Gaiellaceae bacterium]|nr:leucine--tRNA ligase [Gaiellaceae bacterium]